MTVMKIYHYTKSNRLNSIFEDGFIATEMKRTVSREPKNTDYVWLTEKQTYPKTALPMFSMFPELSLMTHMRNKGIHVDLDKIGAVIGKFYRFGFDSTDARFTKWFHSKERTVARCTNQWITMESIANKVGDDIRSFWIATEDLPLENFSLEVFDGGWKLLLEGASVSKLNAENLKTINNLMGESIGWCEEYGIPASHKAPAEKIVAKLIQQLSASFHN